MGATTHFASRRANVRQRSRIMRIIRQVYKRLGRRIGVSYGAIWRS
jgi:hypothetical protein